MRRLWLIVMLFCLSAITANAQGSKKTAIVKGKLINKQTKQPLADVQVEVAGLSITATSNKTGSFVLTKVPYGSQNIIIHVTKTNSETRELEVNAGVMDMKAIKLEPATNVPLNGTDSTIATISLDEVTDINSQFEGDNSGEDYGLMMVGRDPFISTATYVFGRYSFTPRGMGRAQQDVQVNGMKLNSLATTTTSPWNQFGGLGGEFRNKTITYGLGHSDYSFGGINGTTYIRATAADERKGMDVRLAYGDGNGHANEINVTYNSGLSKDGWAYSISGTKRWIAFGQGYTPGKFYDGYGYFGSVSKVIKKSEFDLTAFGTPFQRSRTSATTMEAIQLSGNNYYNPTWGYQNGKIRDSRVQNMFLPVFMLDYKYRPSEKTLWTTTLGYQFGKNENSNIDFYNGSDPKPDYYRNLPSYYDYTSVPNPGAAEAVKEQLEKNPGQMQIDWNRLYNVNYGNTETIHDVNGIAGNDVIGKRSVYVMSNYVTAIKKYTFNTNIQHSINRNLVVYGGLNFTKEDAEDYKQLTDLMGGDFFVNYNQFAPQQYIGNPSYNQNDMNNPNQLIKVGDKYGYDYITHYLDGGLWGQAVYRMKKFEFYLAATAGMHSFSREGLMRNGLFPDNSYGTSVAQNFFTYGVKGGASYTINSKNMMFVNASYSTSPPSASNTYVAESVRDLTVTNPTVQTNKSVEAGYFLNSQKVSGRLVGYVTDVDNATIIRHFFNDDPSIYTFVNYVMQNVNARFIGTELSVSVKVLPEISLLGVVSLGQAFYTNRPTVSVYADNDTSKKSTSRTVYIKNYYLATGPQSAYTAGVKYDKNKFYGSLNFNYFDRNYVAIDPDRRTSQAIDLVQQNSVLWHQIIDQEKLPAYYTVDLRVGKTFELPTIKKLSKITKSDNSSLNVSLGVNNLLNNRNIIAGGYEQLRYDYIDRAPGKFPTKYYYGYGINYYIGLSLRF